MKNAFKGIVSTLALTLALSGCGEPTAPQEKEAAPVSLETEQDQSDALLAFFERTYEEDLASRPETQSYRGIKTDYDKWNDRSEAERDRVAALNKARLEELRTFSSADWILGSN